MNSRPGNGPVRVAVVNDYELVVRGGAALVEGNGAKVAIFSWNLQPELVARSIEQGAAGYLSKSLQGEELVRAIEAINAGQVIVPTRPAGRDREAGDWPGKALGLTAREAE